MIGRSKRAGSGGSAADPTNGQTAPSANGAPPPAASPSELEREVVPDSPELPPQAEPPRAIVPRWVQLVLLPVALFALWALAKAAGKVLLIFVIAALIALILHPAVAFVQRPRGMTCKIIKT